jgi:ring-1,2-phenylacetyl-CoA epoxidase subunit PaaD
MAEITRDDIFTLLAQVKDPEIPVLSLIDLGVIRAVALIDDDRVNIVMTPTFVGCPALDMMKSEIREVLLKNGIKQVDIEITYKEPWTSDMISAKGRAALKQFGLAPPPSRQILEDLEVLEHAVCPRCGHSNTDLKNVFGATLCRSLHYCNDCKEAFEQFKPL